MMQENNLKREEKFKNIYLFVSFESQVYRENEAERDLPTTSLLPKELRIQELLLMQGPKNLRHPSLLFQAISKEVNQKWSSGDRN